MSGWAQGSPLKRSKSHVEMASDNAPAGPLLSEESSACLLDRLDSNILVSILSFLTPREVG